MTGIGLAVALRSKSKTVRVVAPLAGFCAAALLHMSFNTAASLLSTRQQLIVLLFVAIPLVLGLVGYVVRQLFSQGRLVRTRLGDYVRVGWLEPDDPQPLSRLRTRLRALWHALFRGPATFLATLRLQRARDRARLPPRLDGPRARRRRRASAASACSSPTSGRCGRGPSSTGRPRRLPLAAAPARLRPLRRGPRVQPARVPRPGRSGRQLPRAGRGARCAGSVGADCYPLLRGRPQLEASRRVGAALSHGGRTSADAYAARAGAGAPAGGRDRRAAAAPAARRRRRSRPSPPRSASSSTTTSCPGWRPSTPRCSPSSAGRRAPASPRSSTPWSATASASPASSGPPPGRPCWSTTPTTRAGSPTTASCRGWPARRVPAAGPATWSWCRSTRSRPGWPSSTRPTSTPW